MGSPTTPAHFHTLGMNPPLKKELKIVMIGGDKNRVKSCSSQFGIPIGPATLFTLMATDFFSQLPVYKCNWYLSTGQQLDGGGWALLALIIQH